MNQFSQEPSNHNYHDIDVLRDDSFILINVVDSLRVNIKSRNICNVGVAKYLKSEINWIRDQFSTIARSLSAFLRRHSDHPSTLTIENAISQIKDQIEKIRNTVSQAFLAALKDSGGATRYMNNLDSFSQSLHLYLSQFHEQLRCLVDGRISGTI